MRLTMVQVLINSKGYNMNPLQSLYYVSPSCFICLLVPFCESQCRVGFRPSQGSGLAGFRPSRVQA